MPPSAKGPVGCEAFEGVVAEIEQEVAVAVSRLRWRLPVAGLISKVILTKQLVELAP
jgi:hypothetical protein